MMNNPYPCRTRPPTLLYSNKCTIFLLFLALFLLIFGYSLVRIQQQKLTVDNLAAKMSNTFYVVLPSNVTDYPDNRPNRYRVHLPRPLQLTGNYVCALYSIQYPLSWPSTIGTLEPQWIDLKIREDHPIGEYRSVRIPVPSASLKKPTELVEHLAQALKYAQKEVNSTTMRMRREAGSSGGSGDDEILPPIPQPTASGALCIRRGKRVRCQRQSPIPIEEQQQPKTKVKRETTTTPTPASPPSADSPEVNVQNFVTVNVSVEPAKIQKAPPSSPKTSTSSSLTTSVGSISVSVKPFDDDDEHPPQPQPEQEQQQPKKSSKPNEEDLQAAFGQLTDLIGTIKIEYLKNVNGGEDQQQDSDDDDDDAEGDQAKRGPSRGFENDRFRVRMTHPSISHMEMSEQLAYVLGFPNPLRILDGEIARYAADLHGGFSSFAVYAQGLTEEVILGNSLSSLLRIVAVEGDPAHQRHGALIEKIYDSPMYVKVLPREINEIAIEIRTMTGQFVPFQFGNITLTLVFRKVINL